MTTHHEHVPTEVTAEEATIPEGHRLARLPVIAAAVGVVGLGASVAMMGDHFYWSYLTNFMFWLSIALGGLWFTLVHHATRAGWSTVIRRLSENFMVTLPLFAVLFIPVLLGMEHLFHWMHPGDDAMIQAKTPYLNTEFFLVRAAGYFAIWIALSLFFYKSSTRQDSDRDPKLTHRQRWMAPLGILLFALSTTFAAVDWLMSLDPHWFSTIFGVYYFAGSTVAIFSALILVSLMLQRAGLLREVITTEHYHDLGKFLFAFNVFWAYIAFSQYFLIWYANIPEETNWFIYRKEGSWLFVTALVALGHFVVPFFFLMSRHIKRKRKTLAAGAIWMLLMHWVDMYWLVQPVMTHHHGEHGASFHLLDITTFLGIGGLVVAVFAWRLRAKALVPVGDPRLAESLAFENF
ncbi:MAG: quinol:cytochrome C oxidoreductase [Myxococcota bacterium]